MMSDRDRLLNRLSRIREAKSRRERLSGEELSVKSLPGWTELAPRLYAREITFPSPLEESYNNPLLLEDPVNSGDLIFYDCETTGLSGGAGTVIFLIGFGYHHDGQFTVLQYFLADFPGEIDFLKAVESFISSGKIFLSYNGRAFDSHLLRTRFLLKKLRFPPFKEIDLLYPSRRLWKTLLPDCSLGTIETRVLSVHREIDIPGMLVPLRYFDYLRTNNSSLLTEVFHHHQQDILSLAVLFHQIESLEEQEQPFVDFRGMGNLLLSRDKQKGAAYLHQAAENGDVKAAHDLGRYLKRQGEWDEAVTLWETSWNSWKDFPSALELAKYLEHHSRDWQEALAITEEMLRVLEAGNGRTREELLHRRERLRRKLSINEGN